MASTRRPRWSANVVAPPRISPAANAKQSWSRERLAKAGTSMLPIVVSVRGESLTVLLNPHTQHTLSWRQEVGGRLPAGSCNLFSYPLVTAHPAAAKEAHQREETSPRHDRLSFHANSLSNAKAADADDTDDANAVGASDSAGTAARPALLRTEKSQRHLFGFIEQLGFSDSFFDSAEDANVNFAAYFGGIEAFRVLLNNRRTRAIVDLNSAPLRCRRSGFLPIHTAIAAGDKRMYEFLVTLPGIPGRLERIANPTIKTRPCDPHVHKLTALQLACWRGDTAMVQSVIEQRSRFQWRWGPLSAIMFTLAEIDSSDPGGNELMELVIMHDASCSTQEMILDSFMDGMFIRLFTDKWRRFASVQHWALRAIDLVFLVLLITHGLELKADPAACDRYVLPLVLLLLSLFIGSFEIISVVMWVRGRRFSHSSWHAIFSRLTGWAADFHLYRRLSAVVFTAISVVHTLSTRDAPHPSDGTGDEAAWGCLAVGIYFHFAFFLHVLSVPFARLGIFTLVVERLLNTDLPVFLLFFTMYLLNFTAAMYMSYPRAGATQLPFVGEFNHPLEALKRMVELGFTGNSLYVDVALAKVDILENPTMHPTELTAAQQVNFWLFVAFYFLCLIFMSILLLRLFMATLAATFNATRVAAQLEWRLQFARYVYRAELMHPTCLGTTYCGDEVDGKRMYIKITKCESEHTAGKGPGHAVGGFSFVTTDVDGDGKPDLPSTQIVENDLDGDGFPDDRGHEWDGKGSFKFNRKK